jgi:hypothetical protein
MGLLAGADARAAIITTTFTGQVSDTSQLLPGRGGAAGFLTNVDYFGFFGAPGASLQGATFTAVFTTDESTPGATAFYFNSTPSGPGSVIEGATKGVLNLGSGAFALSGGDGGLTASTNVFLAEARNPYFCNFYQCPGISQTLFLDVQGDGSDPFLPPPNYYYTEFSHETGPGDYVQAGSFFAQNTTGTMFERIDLNVLRIDNRVTGTVSPPYPPPPPPPGSIPEPSIWAMMLLGFFAVGSTLRYARSRQFMPNRRRS